MLTNLYICSTLRHLLFALAKATSESDSRSVILFFRDYQNIEESALDTSQLPDHIQLYILTRENISLNLKRSLTGRLLLGLALRTLTVPTHLSNWLYNHMNNLIDGIALTPGKVKLFVFNERNKMARLFRLLVDEYAVIEDGVGNYYEIPVKGYKRYIRALQGKPAKHWVFGEDRKCSAIYAIYPEKLPLSVQNKGIQIDFLEGSGGINTINHVFRYQPNHDFQPDVILATQPDIKAVTSQLNDKSFMMGINHLIVDACENLKLNVGLKLHPKESSESYLTLLPNAEYLPKKIPIEVLLINNYKKPIVLSLCSTSGMGFEKYCRRIMLIPQSELDQLAQIMVRWEKQPEALKAEIQRALTH